MGTATRIHVAVPDGQVPPVQISMDDTLAEYRDNLRMEEAEIALHTPAMLVEGSRLKGTHLHPANIEAFGPTVRHTVRKHKTQNKFR